MIRSFKHKGLERYFLKGSTSGIQSAHEKKLRLILGRLHAAAEVKDMDLPGAPAAAKREVQRALDCSSER